MKAIFRVALGDLAVTPCRDDGLAAVTAPLSDPKSKWAAERSASSENLDGPTFLQLGTAESTMARGVDRCRSPPLNPDASIRAHSLVTSKTRDQSSAAAHFFGGLLSLPSPEDLPGFVLGHPAVPLPPLPPLPDPDPFPPLPCLVICFPLPVSG